MARPIKEGLDYFPLDVDIDQNDKIVLIEAEHGLEGFGVVVKLLMKIYDNSYFYEWGEKEQILFSRRVNVSINKVNDIVNDGIKWGLFSNELYEKHQIISSKSIQKRYLEASLRRKKVKIREDYLLLDNDEVNAYKNVDIVNTNSVKDVNNTQIKGNESKQNKNKEKTEDKMATNSGCDAIDFFNENFGSVTPYERDSIHQWIDNFDEILVLEAMKITIKNNQKSWGYVEGILKNWLRKGIGTIKQVEEEEMEFRRQQSKKRYNQNPNKQDIVPVWFKERRRKQLKNGNKNNIDKTKYTEEEFDDLLKEFSEQKTS